MDESFLSNADVIKASRNFVCIRLATYEDESEAEFLKTVFVNRNGELDNTVFVILTPDTKENLCRAGRGPNFEFRTPDSLVDAMNKISGKYLADAPKDAELKKLPQMKNVRLGLNVSSCDGLPSVICVANDQPSLVEMQAKLAGLAFSDELAGKYVYASTTDPKELESVSGFDGSPGFVLIQPDPYGLKGELIQALPFESTVDQLKAAMISYSNQATKVRKNHNEHVRKGNREGMYWETEIPVTDPDAVRATERNKQRQANGRERPSAGK